MKKRSKVLVLFDAAGEPPEDQDFSQELKTEDWVSERHVIDTLKGLGYQVRTLGIYGDCKLLIEEVRQNRPDIIFNLVEQFGGHLHYDKNVVCLLEMLGVPYTGCGPSGLMLCKNKGVSKKIMNYHRIPSPKFSTFPLKRPYHRPKQLCYPLLVKPLKEEASAGISLNSFVENDDSLRERVDFIRQKMERPAIAEEYVDGKELYVSVIGNRRFKTLPIRELYFGEMPEDGPRIATYKAKWDKAYRKRWKMYNRFAQGVSDEQKGKIAAICRRACRFLNVQGYARLDLRLTPEGKVYIIEVNPNPFLAKGEDFAESAEKAGIKFEKLIEKIVQLGLARSKE